MRVAEAREWRSHRHLELHEGWTQLTTPLFAQPIIAIRDCSPRRDPGLVIQSRVPHDRARDMRWRIVAMGLFEP